MIEIVLTGCTPTPLASYLKALGMLRLLSTACPEIRGAWRDGCFVLSSPWTGNAVDAFFLHQYEPTPIIAPWNGGSGFFENDNKVALEAIRSSTSFRFALYRDCLELAELALEGVGRSSSPKDQSKIALLSRMRGSLPDAALEWLDAVVLLTGDAVNYPPLLGTGGNDGRLDFTNNFMQRLGEVVSLTDEDPPRDSRGWLKAALYGGAAPGLVKKAIGQFAPGQVGGPNATIGFQADSLVNPWDFVLMMEGALLFAAAAVRRNADDPQGILSYPFTVRAVGAGAGTLGENDAANARGEIWMPLWRQFVGYPELRALLAEGRVALNRKPVHDGLDFVRAVHRLGGYRGVHAFQRYGLLMRSGKAYLATSISRVEVTDNPQTEWMDDLDQGGWLATFRRFAKGDGTPNRLTALRRRLEDGLFELAGQRQTSTKIKALLSLLGDINAALAASRKAQEEVPPVPPLGERWVKAVAEADCTPAFRIAQALAGLRGSEGAPLPLRAQLFPVHPIRNVWMTSEYKGKNAGDLACRVRMCIDRKADLPSTLLELLSGRIRLIKVMNMEDKPLRSASGIDLDDLLAFLRSDHMDGEILSLLPGLSLCRIPPSERRAEDVHATPAAFSLLKLCATPDATLKELDLLQDGATVSLPSALVAQLVAGNLENRAVRNAWRRLRASGIATMLDYNALPILGDIDPRRAAAALLIPLWLGAVRKLAHGIVRRTDQSEIITHRSNHHES